ncbi:yeats family-domain-containing protein [Chiua virens]|nr:yeats family-domain-containing protein [Chiua virens]
MADRVRVRGVTIHRPVIYGNTATVLTAAEKEHAPDGHTHRWTVAVRGAASAPNSDDVGGADDLGYFVKRVTFKLHETYSNPSRNIDKAPFEVSETGWGEFEIQIRINFINESGEKSDHALPSSQTPSVIPSPENAAKLGPVHSWQYDEIVFTDPFQSFLTLLTAHPPTALSKGTKKPIPFHTSNPASLQETKRSGVPEFTSDMEKEEAERLEEARGKIVKEQEKWRVAQPPIVVFSTTMYLSPKDVGKSYRPRSYVMSPGLLRAREPFRFQNALTGLVLAGFATAVWAYSIRAVKQDDFSDVDEEAREMMMARSSERQADCSSRRDGSHYRMLNPGVFSPPCWTARSRVCWTRRARRSYGGHRRWTTSDGCVNGDRRDHTLCFAMSGYSHVGG